MKKSFDENEQPSPAVILTLASYKSLSQYDWHNQLVENDKIRDVMMRHVVNYKREQDYKLRINALGNLKDETSKRVRNQYEASPYPRWVQTALSPNPMPVKKLLAELDLKLYSLQNFGDKGLQILIAGCGTGQHAIGTATRFAECEVLAIDLSLSSLAYARRQTEELGLSNIEYLQAGILEISELDRKFDIIESVGFFTTCSNLSWKTLSNCLKYGGLMRIGLYSDAARQWLK